MILLCRIHESKKATKRFKKDIRLLAEKLDKHEDPFRIKPLDEAETEKSRPIMKAQAIVKQVDKPSTSGGKKQASKRKSKADKVDSSII